MEPFYRRGLEGNRSRCIWSLKMRDDVAEFCWFYARWLRSPLAERLKAEVYQLLEEVLTW